MRRPAASIVLVMFLAGCGGVRGGAARPQYPTATASVSKLTRVPPTGLPQPLRGARIGTSQSVDSSDAHLEVTVRAVIDPLRRAGVRLPSHSRAVGVLVQIRSSGPAVYDSSATGDFHVVASTGRATPALARRGVCRTPPEDFDRYITSGEDRVGCVVFTLPRDARVEGVRFDPHAQLKGRLTWVAAAVRTG